MNSGWVFYSTSEQIGGRTAHDQRTHSTFYVEYIRRIQEHIIFSRLQLKGLAPKEPRIT